MSGTTASWFVVVRADRALYEAREVTHVRFPVGTPDRTVALTGDEVTIGRRSDSLGTAPAIDLAGPPEDGGVSHRHASLVRADDGTWALVDHGSTNGTWLNDATEPLTPGEAAPLVDGDRFAVGLWTRIEIAQGEAP